MSACPSGLSWLANGVGIPVVLISGFTLPLNEFATPYRVINYHVCNGCWNDTQIVFDHKDFEWCPRLKGTERQYECSRYITPEAVNKVIDRLMADHRLDPLAAEAGKGKAKAAGNKKETGADKKMSLYYYKDMFKVQDLEQAKNIILTEEQQGG